MLIPTLNWFHHCGNRFVNEQLQRNRDEFELYVWEHEPQLNGDRHYCYDAILSSIKDQSGVVFFVNGLIDTGKTFFYNIVTANVQSKGKIVICVASFGIAALLLKEAALLIQLSKFLLNLMNIHALY